MPDSVTIYGIANCDTIKKAKTWLTSRDIEFHFHDYRKQGLDSALLQQWVSELGWEVLLNKRGTTWRQLPDDIKNGLDNESSIAVMLDNPAIIKRPLLVKGNVRHVGFSDADYVKIFG